MYSNNIYAEVFFWSSKLHNSNNLNAWKYIIVYYIACVHKLYRLVPE